MKEKKTVTICVSKKISVKAAVTDFNGERKIVGRHATDGYARAARDGRM